MNIKDLLDKIAENPEDFESLAQAKKLAENYDDTLQKQEQRLTELLEQNRKLFKLITVSENHEPEKHHKQEKMNFEDFITKEEN